jgi:hypothetical protein
MLFICALICGHLHLHLPIVAPSFVVVKLPMFVASFVHLFTVTQLVEHEVVVVVVTRPV